MPNEKEGEKKDLTGIVEYARKMQDSGQAPAVPEGSVMEEQKIDKIDAFESLTDYAKSNPAPEPPSDDFPVNEPAASSDFPVTPAEAQPTEGTN